MNAVLTSTPPRTQAAILRQVLAEKHPKFALGDIAHRFGLTMDQLQAILRRYGYPDPARMTKEAVELELEAQDRAAADPVADDAGDVATIFTRVPVNQLLSDPDNPREHLENIEELADSILSVGLLQPIVARREGDRLVVVAGHRRLAAVRHLKWSDVPVIIRGPMRPDHVIAAMLIENGQRTDLDPIEEARGLAKLKKSNSCSEAELGRMIGRSGAFVSMRMALLDLTVEEQTQVRAGTLKLTYAVRRGRLNSGRAMPAGQERGWHLSDTHTLAAQVKARCIRLGHNKSGRKIGGTGCGECWETVIRTDERRVLLDASHDGVCPTCGSQS